MTSKSIERSVIGQLKDAEALQFLLCNGNGISVTCVNYGARITSVTTPDKTGVTGEIALCPKTFDGLVADQGAYFGATPGRFSNRIKEGKFTLDGLDYQLAVNNGANHLHGGVCGFDKILWDSKEFEENDGVGVEFSLYSKDGDENYPGNLQVKVKYFLTIGNDLIISYWAICDKATPVNFTNHSYWNLSGDFKANLFDHDLKLSCSSYLPTTEAQIPTGELRSVSDDPLFNFKETLNMQESVLNIGENPSGIDHCFVVDGAIATKEDGTYSYNYDAKEQVEKGVTSPYIRPIGVLTHLESGRMMVVKGTQPGVQVYSANYLGKPSEKEKFPFIQHNAVCLETQHFPDSVNQLGGKGEMVKFEDPKVTYFPNCVLRPEDPAYFHQTIFSFRTF